MLRLETKFTPIPQDGLAADAVTGRFEGYATLFDLPDEQGDRVAPGAFARSLAQRQTPVKLLWQHEPTQPIGVWESLTEDSKGLRVQGRLVLGTQLGSEAAALLAAGALDGLSIGYRVREAEQLPQGRRLLDLDLWEISLVTFPMLPQARIGPSMTPMAPPPPEPPAMPPMDAAPIQPPAPTSSEDPAAMLAALTAARAALR